MQWKRFQSPVTLQGESQCSKICCVKLEIYKKKPIIFTLYNYISHFNSHSLIINLLHYSTKVYLCFPWVFNRCQEWLCSNINETCPSTKISTVAGKIHTSLQKAKGAASHIYTCNYTHTHTHRHTVSTDASNNWPKPPQPIPDHNPNHHNQHLTLTLTTSDPDPNHRNIPFDYNHPNLSLTITLIITTSP